MKRWNILFVSSLLTRVGCQEYIILKKLILNSFDTQRHYQNHNLICISNFPTLTPAILFEYTNRTQTGTQRGHKNHNFVKRDSNTQ